MPDLSPFDLSGKVAIITGAATGIGRGIADRLVASGARVVIADIDGERGRAAAAEIDGGVFVDVDLTDPGSPQVAVAEVLEQCGQADILVNNAGIYPNAPLLEITPDFFDRMIAIDLRGMLFMTQAFVRPLLDAGRPGKVVNIASISGIRAPLQAGQASYGAAKGGVISLTIQLARELAPEGIHVNAVAPGFTLHEELKQRVVGAGMPLEEWDRQVQNATNRIPLGRVGGPDDIGKAVSFLASAASDFVLGVTLMVDGGWSLC